MHVDTPTPTPEAPALLSIAETARTLGVSRRTVERAIADGTLPAIRIARRRLIEREAVAEFIAAAREAGGSR